MTKKLLPILIVYAAVILIYYPALTTFFSQDDFFHFKVSQTDGSLSAFINLFGFHSFTQRGIAFYRPISRELLFNLYYPFFGLNALPFRIFSFQIHFLNIYLVYILVQNFFKNKNLSFFVSFFFGITSANVATLYYLAGGLQTLLATTFTLATLLLIQKYLETSLLKYKLLAFLTFILGLCSHEQVMIIPFLILGLIWISKPTKNIKRYLKDLIPYFIIILIFIYLEISKIGFSSSEIQYKLIFNIKTAINSLSWYSIWALGIPETLIDFVLPGLKLNPNLLKYWGNYYLFILPSFFISISFLTVAITYLFIKARNVLVNKTFWFAFLWFPLGLLPVILLPLHKSTHYLEISLPAFWIVIGYIVFNFYYEVKNKKMLIKAFLFFLISSLLILSATSAILGSTNYWAASRGKLAEKLITNVRTTYPTLPKGSKIYFKNDPTYPVLTKEWGGSSKQANTILNGSDALELLYKDPTIKVYYEDIEVPKNLKSNIYSLTAKIY